MFCIHVWHQLLVNVCYRLNPHAPITSNLPCLVLAVTLPGLMLRNRCWPTTFYTITAGDAEGTVSELVGVNSLSPYNFVYVEGNVCKETNIKLMHVIVTSLNNVSSFMWDLRM